MRLFNMYVCVKHNAADGGGGESAGGSKSVEMQLYGEGSGLAQDADGKRHELNMAERAAQSSRIAQMLQDAQEEHTRLQADNLELQKLLVPIMNKKVCVCKCMCVDVCV
jgi:hypothetical protein